MSSTNDAAIFCLYVRLHPVSYACERHGPWHMALSKTTATFVRTKAMVLRRNVPWPCGLPNPRLSNASSTVHRDRGRARNLLMPQRSM